MKKKGFTLVELLAVIVILAIVLVIAVPAVGNLIQGAKGKTFTSQKKLVEDAASLYYMTYASNLIWEDNVSSITIGELKNKGFIEEVRNPLNNQVITDDTVVLVLKDARGNMTYSLQMYDDIVMEWYRNRMIEAFKEGDYTLPSVAGETNIVNLDELITAKRVDELRLPLDLTSRCAGYVEVAKTANDYEYNAYVDCLTNASTFASHYVSYGGKYLDNFSDVKQTTDGGYIAVGDSNSDVITKYGNQGKGKNDAIIVKFKADGTVEWSQNFGGTNADYFNGVIETTDGYVAVGRTSSNDGDLAGLYKGGNDDALLVKFSKQGNVMTKISHGSSGNNGTDTFNKIIKVDGGFIVVGSACILVRDGDMTDVTAPGTRSAGIIIKYDDSFNLTWRSFFSGTFYENFTNVLQASDGGYVISGSSSSYDADMVGLAYDNIYVDTEAIVLKYDNAGNLQYKNSFKGSKSEYFSSLVETSDGYIFAGGSASINGDMASISRGNNEINDGILVKYNKTLSTVTWKKVFGGTNEDIFNSVALTSDNNLVVVGYSSSEDIDMTGKTISQNGYSNSIMLNYNSSTGNMIKTIVFGGHNTDVFNSVIKTSDNKYVAAGSTYSSDYYLKNFNKGHRDAILVAYDNNLNLIKTFNEPVVIIDKLKTIVPNYGTTISTKYENIYTTNNPEVDLKGWCSPYSYYANNINYNYGWCLSPFNSDDVRQITNGENANNYKTIRAGEFEYPIEGNVISTTNWYKIFLYFTSGGGAGIEISNLKLKFQDGYVGSLTEAVSAGYIEPLVIVSSSISVVDIYFFPNSIDIINPGGTTGMASYPSLDLRVKPKKSKLTSVIFTSSRDIITNSDGFKVFELRNFDMSITPTQ